MRGMFQNEEAQASVIGTIMALMVVLAFLAVFTEQFVPAAMTDYESEHMDVAETQFSTLKQTIDNEILTSQTTLTFYSPITLSSRNVPVWTRPTAGELRFYPKENSGDQNISFSYNATQVREKGRGTISLYCPNRYFTPQTLAYEGGAVILSQGSNSIMRAPPHFTISNKSGVFNVSVVLMNLIGSNAIYIGTGTTGVSSHLAYADSWMYDKIDNNTIWFHVNSSYSRAWFEFFKETLKKATNGGETSATSGTKTEVHHNYYDLTLIENPDAPDNTGTISLTLKNVNSLTLKRAYVDIEVGKEELKPS